jgi:hypothetical protein
MADLAKHSEAVEEALLELMERMKDEANKEDGSEIELPAQPEPEEPEGQKPSAAPALDFATRQRIEQLFEEARKDRSRSMRLKQELDRLGVFKMYENRFLDLFKRAG